MEHLTLSTNRACTLASRSLHACLSAQGETKPLADAEPSAVALRLGREIGVLRSVVSSSSDCAVPCMHTRQTLRRLDKQMMEKQ